MKPNKIKNILTNKLCQFHSRFVFQRRANVLVSILDKLIPQNTSILDVGCGNGLISSLISKKRPDIKIRGIELSVRPKCLIPCTAFDGINIPFEDSSFDVCLFIDVLHHTHEIPELMKEATRVSKRNIIIKDHICKNSFDKAVLSLMDWIGNKPHGIKLEYLYLQEKKWKEYFHKCGLKNVVWKNQIYLYPFPFNLIFGRKLHFISLLEKM